MEGKRIIAARMGNGHIGLIEDDIPQVKPGAVLVEVHASLVSPGSGVGGWRGLKRELENPKSDAKPRPFGYANSGVVVEVGDGVEELKEGDRVACMGGGYALHTNYALIPHNLCVPLPDKATFAHGAYGHLAATAVQVLRRGEPEFGESIVVVGLGVLGQLTGMVYKLAGNFVIGWDYIPFRTEIAQKWGIDAAAVPGVDNEAAVAKEFTNGYGVDAAVIAFGGDANTAIEKLYKCFKCSPDGHLMGRIMVPGGASFEYTGRITNMDIRKVGRTGPGYHDEAWEYGPDYPPVHMRWTTQTNLKLCMKLMAEGQFEVDSITTHVIPLEDVTAQMSKIIEEPDKILGVIFESKH